jgi:hypothetical protein
MTNPHLETFTAAYITCALWSSTDDNDEPMDDTYGVDDIAPETLATIHADCSKFFDAHRDVVMTSLTSAGHDFWLTRNGHGAGFWDGDWAEPDATELTASSEAFGQVDLYIGDDLQVWS